MSLFQPEPEQPVKRRRGRPAKQNKDDGNYPSFTMQFRAYPEPSSPSSELNSNMIMQRGEPDTFTPLMRVSPSSTRKRARKPSSASTSTTESPTWEQIASQSKAKPYMGLTPATLNKLSDITSDHASPPPYLNSPPNSALKPSLRMSPEFKESPRLLESSPLPNRPGMSVMKDKDQKSARSISFIEDNLFSFELTVDGGGRAALAHKYRDNKNDENSSEPSRPSVSSSAESCMSLGSSSVLGTSVSDSGLETSEKYIVPQTPNQRDCVTPRMESIMENYNMAFNLTPQFNSMMYSMMSINSPQVKPPYSPHIKIPPSSMPFEERFRKGELEGSINTAELVDADSAVDFSVDEGDARAALKRAFKKF